MKGITVSVLALLLLGAPVRADWVSLGGYPGQPPEIDVLEDGPQGTTIDVWIPGYYLDTLLIENQPYSAIRLPGAIISLDQAWPELPLISKSIIVPDDARMSYEILQTEYEGGHALPLVPSKGSLLRTVNPDSLPYTFGDFYQSDAWWPEEVVELHQPFIVRDFRGITLHIRPFQHNAVQESLQVCKHLVVRVYPDGPGQVNVKTRPRNGISWEFSDIYANVFLNFSEVEWDTLAEPGRMLIIAADDFYDAMLPLVEWKMKKGIPTRLVGCSQIGGYLEAMRDYIQDEYDAGGLTFVLLVGDGNTANLASSKTVPYALGTVGDAWGEPADPVYAYLEGEDWYPDVFVSRLSAETVEQVENQVARAIDYERNPHTLSDWYHRGMGIASDQGYPADSTRCNSLREQLLGYTYTWVDKVYEGYGSAGDLAAMTTNAFNEGRSIVNFIGHGTRTAWHFTSLGNWFDCASVANLDNPDMLPLIISVACWNGAFVDTTCFAEAWLRAGSAARPAGAIAFYGSSIPQTWFPPCVAQAAAVDLLTHGTMNTVGGILFNGACQMIAAYEPSIRGVEMFQTWHIFGDASVQIMTDTPSPLIVSHPSIYSLERGSFAVDVGVEGALVCLWKENEGYHQAQFTGSSGQATFYTSFSTNGPLWITATKHNCIPYEALVTSGPLLESQTWPPNVYVFGDVVVPSGVTLHLAGGNVVTFASTDAEGGGADAERCELIVDGGALEAGCSNCDWITFTSDASEPEPGDWWGVRSLNAGHVRLERAEIEHGAWGVMAESSVVDVQVCEIHDNSEGGIWARIPGLGTQIFGCTLEDNGWYGIHVQGGSPHIMYNTISLHCCGIKLEEADSAALVMYNTLDSQRGQGDPPCDPTALSLRFSSAIVRGNTVLGPLWRTGIFCYNSCPLIEECVILDGVEVGIACAHQSDPVVHSNQIFDYTSMGISCSESCPILGRAGAAPPYNGQNTVLTTVPTATHEVYGESVSCLEVDAEWNWWGATEPDPGRFSPDVDYDPWLICPPVSVHEPDERELPSAYTLSQNYPNPFNADTEIGYSLAQAGRVRMEVFNLLGQRVCILVDEDQTAGYKVVRWNGRNDRGLNVASGIYSILLRTGKVTVARKALLLR